MIKTKPQFKRTPAGVCHLKVPRHDEPFFRLLSEVFPSWKEVKQRLEQAEF